MIFAEYCYFHSVVSAVMPSAMVHTEKIMKYVLSGQKNVKFKNVSRNCFAFCLKAQDDAAPSFFY